MLLVKIHIAGEEPLVHRLTKVRNWLDDRQIKPADFRWTVEAWGVVLLVELAAAADAAAFASAFEGQVISLS